MAINCASEGCPKLRREPYIAEKLDSQLNDQSKEFLSNPQRFRFDPSDKTFHVSPIFKWFIEDFVAVYDGGLQMKGLSEKEKAVTAFVARFVDIPSKGEFDLDWLDYSWALNDQKK